MSSNPKQNLSFNQLNYYSTEIKWLRLENENLITQVKEAERIYKFSQTEEIEFKEAFLSEKKNKFRIAVTSLESKLYNLEVKKEQKVTENQNIAKWTRKLERCL